MERTIPARNSNETPRIPQVVPMLGRRAFQRAKLSAATSHDARERLSWKRRRRASPSSSLSSSERRPSRPRHRAGSLIKSKRPIRRRDKGTPTCRQVVSSAHRSGRDGAAISGLKTHGETSRVSRSFARARRSFSLVTCESVINANSIRQLIWLTSCARNIRLWTVSPIPVLRLMTTRLKISIRFVVSVRGRQRRWKVYSG